MRFVLGVAISETWDGYSSCLFEFHEHVSVAVTQAILTCTAVFVPMEIGVHPWLSEILQLSDEALSKII